MRTRLSIISYLKKKKNNSVSRVNLKKPIKKDDEKIKMAYKVKVTALPPTILKNLGTVPTQNVVNPSSTNIL